MKLGATIALLLGLALAWAGMAHDHPPPTDCPSTCNDIQCKCVDACNKMGEAAGAECYRDCYDRKMACHSRCNMIGSDCLNTDRCARPRG